MNPINHKLNPDQLQEVFAGIKDSVDILSASFGASPGNAMYFSQAGGIAVFDDGYQALLRYNPDSVHQRMGKALVFDASAATFRVCGDGTSTTGILAGLLMSKYDNELPQKNANTADNIEYSLESMMSLIDSITKDVNQSTMRLVAYTAMHGDETLAAVVSDIVWQVGEGGIITAEVSKNGEIYAERSYGIEAKGGFSDPGFANRGGNMVVPEARLLFINSTVSEVKHEAWAHIFNTMARENWTKPLVVVSLGATGSFLQTLIDNKKPIYSAKVDSPAHLKYIADVFKATVYSEEKSSFRHQIVDLDQLPVVSQVKCTKDKTSILPGAEHNVDHVVAKIQALVDAGNATEEDIAAIPMLRSTFGTIFVPQESASQFSELKEKIEDGYNACMQAFKGVISLEVDGETYNGGHHMYKFLASNTTSGAMSDAFAALAILTDSDFRPYDCANTLKVAIKNACGVALPFLRTKTFVCDEY